MAKDVSKPVKKTLSDTNFGARMHIVCIIRVNMCSYAVLSLHLR